jgi:hypothetical protein
LALPSDQEAEEFLQRQLGRLPPRMAERVHRLRRAPFLPRTLAGLLLVCGGLAWFLPILGFWMLPLGLILLADQFRITKRLLAGAAFYFARRRRR